MLRARLQRELYRLSMGESHAGAAARTDYDFRALADELMPLAWSQTRDYAYVLMDSEGRVVRWGGGAEHIFGYSESDLLGQSIALIFSDEDRQRGAPEQEIATAIASGRAMDDRWHYRKDGGKVWVSGVLMSLRDGESLKGFAKIMRDRTDAKIEIEALRRRNDSLERHTIDRDQAFARFTHELRNALGPIGNAVELLLHTPETQQFAFPLSIIKRQAGFIERMAHDLSELAQSNVGKLKLSKQEIELSAELAQIVATIRSRAEQKKQAFTALLPNTPITILGDRQRLHQVFFNLLDNAIKYTPEGGRIWLKCMVETTWVIVKVEDNGQGISKEMLPVIFDLFTQETPDTSEGGFGVGLSLVKELVEAHGGSVKVRSEGKGKGSEFTVSLPIEQR